MREELHAPASCSDAVPSSVRVKTNRLPREPLPSRTRESRKVVASTTEDVGPMVCVRVCGRVLWAQWRVCVLAELIDGCSDGVRRKLWRGAGRCSTTTTCRCPAPQFL